MMRLPPCATGNMERKEAQILVITAERFYRATELIGGKQTSAKTYGTVKTPAQGHITLRGG